MELTTGTGPDTLAAGQKALKINLNARKYGTFAEIGAGQEVVRWFFRVGGASNTIAKSISAYDMSISDAIYGECSRYVSRDRLERMLQYEYDLLVERLADKRGDTSEFFAFANTVATRNFKGTNECHGWLGIRFQSQPHGGANQILIHVRMLDTDRVAQQEALGIVGLNLCYASFSYWQNPDLLMESLLDNLSTDRIEIDMILCSGPDFEHLDHRMLAVKLVRLGLTDAAMFKPDGTVLQPSEVLYKRSVVVERGSFRPVTHVNLDMIEAARSQFVADWGEDSENPVVLFEITLNNLLSPGEIDYDDFIARVELLASTGATVLISDYLEYYRLAQYLGRLTKKKIAMVMGIPSLRDLFDEKFYEHLEGGILESFGRLFKNELRLYVYPLLDDTHHLINVSRLRVAPHLQNLYSHLLENGSLQSIDFYNRDYLHIFSRDVLRHIASGDTSWEKMVPDEVAVMIKERHYFGYNASSKENPNGASLDGHAPNLNGQSAPDSDKQPEETVEVAV
jgi:hypothetical protein